MYAQCDNGANAIATPYRHVLRDIHKVPNPLVVYPADTSSQGMTCTEVGYFDIFFVDHPPIAIKMYFCKNLSCTIISPQMVCNATDSPFSGCRINDFLGDCSAQFALCNSTTLVTAPLQKHNNLLFFVHPTTRINAVLTLTRHAALQAELWHQRLGHPGTDQLRLLPKHATGLPTDLHRNRHVLASCPACTDAAPVKPPCGPTSTAPLLPGQRFHIDFGFMRASSFEFVKQANLPRVVTSIDGNNAFLILVDAATQYSWVFPTASKRAPYEILDAFLSRHGATAAPKSVRMDQGSEFWRSQDIRQVLLKHDYAPEPTGSDAAHQNGRAERYNRTFGVMVRTLLYSAGLHPKFWSYAPTHATYLRNRLVSAPLGITPFEAWHGTKPTLDHLRVFGCRVTARRPGKPASKLDKHVTHGVFLGFSGTTSHIWYCDLDSQQIKLSQNHVFDESSYAVQQKPPGPQLLYQLGLTDEIVASTLEPNPFTALLQAAYPKMPSTPLTTPRFALLAPLPLAETVPTPASLHSVRAIDPVHAYDAMMINISMDPFNQSFPQPINIAGNHPTCGLVLADNMDRHRPQLLDILASSPCRKIFNWRSRLKLSYILRINNTPVYTTDDVIRVFAQLRQCATPTTILDFAHDDAAPTLDFAGLPQIYYDQVRVYNAHIQACRTKSLQAKPVKLTRRRLLLQDDWNEWEAAEFKQLDAYDSQNMFGKPIIAPINAAIFFWVWVYVIKPHENNRKKARAVCDGSTRGGQSQVTGHTFAATPDMIDFRLLAAIAADQGLVIYQADVSNAFAEAHKPKQTYYMKPDAAFKNWWNKRHPSDVLGPTHVVPIERNLQGHPEAPRMWSLHIDNILLNKLGFTTTTHAPCLYKGTVNNTTVFIVRQVDDIGIACRNADTYEAFCKLMDAHLSMPLTRLGIMQHFNGVDVIQSATYIHLHVASYLDKLFEAPHWQSLLPTALPMKSDNAYMKSLDAATPLTPTERDNTEQKLFRYRTAIGELVWPMVTTRPDISYAVVKLSQFSTNPAQLHFYAVQQVFQYLLNKRQHGLTYTRKIRRPDLPKGDPVQCTQPTSLTPLPIPTNKLYCFSDSNWGMDICHRRSISGILVYFGGCCIAWKCRVQPTISLSTTEAEFIAASDAGRLILYLRLVLSELGFEQTDPTPLFEDNVGALLMTRSAISTRQTRHIDIRNFALKNWEEQAYIVMTQVKSEYNPSDILTKPVPLPILTPHYEHLSGCLVYHHVYPNEFGPVSGTSLASQVASVPNTARGGVSPSPVTVGLGSVTPVTLAKPSYRDKQQ